MNKLNFLIAILLIIGCTKQKETQYQVPKKVTIAGTVINFSTEKKEIDFVVNRLGLSSETYNSKLDSLGNFSVTFENYTPTDVLVNYKTSIWVLTHPGDSIHVIFDGSLEKRPAILKTVKFSGDGAKINQDAAVFQKMYFSGKFYNDFNRRQDAIKNYEIQIYIKHLDTIKQNSKALYDKFVSEVKPDQETKIWALTFVEKDYYNALAEYPMKHEMYNQLQPGEWNVPLSYYEPLKARFPIRNEMLISGYALSRFVNSYHSAYVFEHWIRSNVVKKFTTKTGRRNVPRVLVDSMRVYSIIKNTPDDLMRQMVLTELFRQGLETNQVDLFETYSHVINEYIKEPFLKEPLIAEYNKVKNWTANPEITSNAMLKNVANSSANQIMDEIQEQNKGKLIYIDCWATWCGPCIGEFSNSKKLMKQMEDKNVAFVFICFESEEKGWNAILSKHQLEGQHYLLTFKQSRELRKALEITGFPYYFLFDKEGVIVDKGTHLRPFTAKTQIAELLK